MSVSVAVSLALIVVAMGCAATATNSVFDFHSTPIDHIGDLKRQAALFLATTAGMVSSLYLLALYNRP